MSYSRRVWFGDVIKEKGEAAAKRGLAMMGERVVARAQVYVHVDTGALQASISATTVSDDQVDVGSDLEYAIIEEVVRGHAYIAPAVADVEAEADSIMAEAFRQEGLG